MKIRLLLFLYYSSLLGPVIWDFSMLPCGSWFIANLFAYNFALETALACSDAWAADAAWYTNIANLPVVGSKAVRGQPVGITQLLVAHAVTVFVTPEIFAHYSSFNVFVNLMATSQAFILYEEVLTRTLSLVNFYELVGFDIVPSSPYDDVESNTIPASISDFQDQVRRIRHYCVNPWQLDSDEKWDEFYNLCVYTIHLFMNIISIIEVRLKQYGHRFAEKEIICAVTKEPYTGSPGAF